MIEIAFTEQHSVSTEMEIREVLTAPRSPWQNPYAERFIGSLRRVPGPHHVFSESSLRHILKAYFEYYEHSRTHLALEKDAQCREPLKPAKLVL
jgi:transposase InsO family protein